MFGGSPQTAGFLDIQWADIVFILVLRGSVRWESLSSILLVRLKFLPSSCLVANTLVRMEAGDILRFEILREFLNRFSPRFDTMNTSGLWNLSPQSSEVIVIAHE